MQIRQVERGWWCWRRAFREDRHHRSRFFPLACVQSANGTILVCAVAASSGGWRRRRYRMWLAGCVFARSQDTRIPRTPRRVGSCLIDHSTALYPLWNFHASDPIASFELLSKRTVQKVNREDFHRACRKPVASAHHLLAVGYQVKGEQSCPLSTHPPFSSPKTPMAILPGRQLE